MFTASAYLHFNKCSSKVAQCTSATWEARNLLSAAGRRIRRDGRDCVESRWTLLEPGSVLDRCLDVHWGLDDWTHFQCALQTLRELDRVWDKLAELCYALKSRTGGRWSLQSFAVLDPTSDRKLRCDADGCMDLRCSLKISDQPHPTADKILH